MESLASERSLHYESPMNRWSARVAVAALFATCAATGCDDDGTTTLSFAVPTEIAVDPADFLGDTSCSTFSGAMRSYVVTLSAFTDESDTTAFTLGSTGATPCSLVAGFRDNIVLGQVHIAEIDGYDVPPEALTPFGGASSGSRQLLDATTGERVSPRWTTRCGSGADDGAVAASARRVFVRPCEPLVDREPTPTQIALGAAAVLGDDACEVAAQIDVEPLEGAAPPPTTIACDGDPLVVEAEPDTTYELYATATVGDVLHGTICSASARRGVTVTARCHPLSPSGLANVTLSAIETGGGDPLCPADGFFDVIVGDAVQNSTPLPCGRTAVVGPLAAGLVLFGVVTYDAQGALLGAGTCGAEVAPGRAEDALCLASN